MRFLRGFVLFFALLVLTSPAALAGQEDAPAAQWSALELDKLERLAGEYAPEQGFSQGISLERGLSDLLDTGAGQVQGIFRRAVRSGVLLLVVVMLCGVAEGMAEQGSHTFQAAPIAGVLAVCALSAGDVNTLMGLGRRAIESLSGFGDVLLPTMAAAAAAGGAPAGAAARQLATALFSHLLVQLITRVLIPMLYLYIAASAVFAAVGNGGVRRMAKTLKGLVTCVLTTVLLAFTGYLSISGVIAGTTDAVTLKTAKLAMSGMVPVVGGVLSDAAETVLAGAGVLRNAVGIFGTLVILSICLLPFLQLGIHYLVYKLAAALAATVSQGGVAAFLDDLGGAFALMLAMTASCAVLLLISVISCLTAAGVV